MGGRSEAIRQLARGVGNWLDDILRLSPEPWPPVGPSTIPRVRPGPPAPQPQPQPPTGPGRPRFPDLDQGYDPAPDLAPDPAADPAPEPQPEPTPGPTTNPEDEPCEDCPKCPPRDEGSETSQSYGAEDHDVRLSTQRGYDYQHSVCPWHAHNRAGRSIMEWTWGGTRFDGLDPAQCLLHEAKYGYDAFLIDNWVEERPELADWVRRCGFDPFQGARRQ